MPFLPQYLHTITGGHHVFYGWCKQKLSTRILQFCFFFLLLNVAASCKDDVYKGTLSKQNVTLMVDSSKISAYVLLNRDKIKLDNELYYYSYKSGKIKRTQGGIGGKPLTDIYHKYDMDDNLKEVGYFEKGLKTGEWKTWHKNGTIKSIENWKNGEIKGKARYFNADGSLIAEGRMKNNNKHGRWKELRDGEMESVRYRHGEEKPCWFLNIFKRNKKDTNEEAADSTRQENKADSTATDSP